MSNESKDLVPVTFYAVFPEDVVLAQQSELRQRWQTLVESLGGTSARVAVEIDPLAVQIEASSPVALSDPLPWDTLPGNMDTRSRQNVLSALQERNITSVGTLWLHGRKQVGEIPLIGPKALDVLDAYLEHVNLPWGSGGTVPGAMVATQFNSLDQVPSLVLGRQYALPNWSVADILQDNVPALAEALAAKLGVALPIRLNDIKPILQAAKVFANDFRQAQENML